MDPNAEPIKPRHYQAKTDRKWGMWREIRRLLASKRKITWRDLSPPLTRHQATGNLKAMHAHGQLDRVKSGTLHRQYSDPAVYVKKGVIRPIAELPPLYTPSDHQNAS